MDQVNYQLEQDQQMSSPQRQRSFKNSNVLWVIAVAVLFLSLIGVMIFSLIQIQEAQALQLKVADMQSEIDVKDSTIKTLTADLENVKNRANLVSYIFTETSKPNVTASEQVAVFLELQERVKGLNDPIATQKLNNAINSLPNPGAMQDFLLYLIQSVGK